STLPTVPCTSPSARVTPSVLPESSKAGAMVEQSKRDKGFRTMDPQQRAAIASLGGKTAHQRGVAHTFSPAEASAAGKRGGDRVSADRAHMSQIGRLGGLASWYRPPPEVVRQRIAQAQLHGWPEDPFEFGSLIRSAREILQLSRMELAKRVGLSCDVLRII